MIGKTLLHYKILSRLGVGGMGEVYVAEDTKLGRRVALKVLPPEMAQDPERRQRFEREARAVAALQHPNIVTLHSVEESDGVHFLTMELVEGRPLAAVIPEHGLPVDDLLDLAVPLADALASAHAKQITHRDLKPDNIIVGDGGRAKILDFGLAKLIVSAATGSRPPGRDLAGDQASDDAETLLAESDVTQEGRILGTVAYMSPEQAQGKAVDHRTDIFSLGVLLYEMATGQRPFQGDTSISIISSILKDEPTSITQLNRTVPEHLGRIIGHCLAKDPDDRCQSALDLRNELQDLKQEVAAQRTLASRSSLAINVPGFSGRRRRWLPLVAVAIGVFVIGLVPIIQKFFFEPAPGIGTSGRPSVAVVSFEDHSGSEEIRWLATGLPSMLLTGLAQAPGLDVVSSQRIHEILKQIGQESVESVDKAVISEIARRAGAGAVVVGSIFKSGPDIRIDVQVEDVETGHLLFAQEVTGREVFPLVDELTDRIRTGLNVASPPDLPRVAEVTSESLEAYRLYSQGLEALYNSRDADAQRLMLAALEIDPSFGMAYFRLAEISRGIGDLVSGEEYERKTLEHLDRLPERQRLLVQASQARRRRGDSDEAIRILEGLLDRFPDEEDGYEALASIYRGDFLDNGRAAAVLERAIQAIPGSGPLRNSYGYSLLWQGRYAEGLREIEAYQRLLPDEPNPLDSLAEAYLITGQPEKALEKYGRVLAADSTFSNSYVGRAYAYAMLGRYDEALGEMEREAEVLEKNDFPLTTNLFVRAFLLSRVGRYRDAEERIREGIELTASLEDVQMQVTFEFLSARLAQERGRFSEVIESVERARPMIPEGRSRIIRQIQTEDALAYLGVTEARSGRLEAARRHLEAQKEVGEPLRAFPWFRRWPEGEIALAEGDLAAADSTFAAGEPPLKAFFSVAMTAGSVLVNNSPLRDWEARLEVARGDLAAAIEVYRRLTTPDIGAKWTAALEPRFILEMARLLDQSGDAEGARREYRRFLDLWKDADPGLTEVEETEGYLARVAG